MIYIYMPDVGGVSIEGCFGALSAESGIREEKSLIDGIQVYLYFEMFKLFVNVLVYYDSLFSF